VRGQYMRNFDLTDALDPVLDDRVEPMPAVEIGSTKKRFRPGDIVISRLRAYLREIALVRTSPGVETVGSSEFIVLRPDAEKKSGLTPETLLIYLRSLPVQTILKWSQDGSQHPRFNEADLLAVPVPAALESLSPEIDKLVNKALAGRKEATALVEEAKLEVERMVLKEAK
jgi:type I restriction enzyme, S subunit